MLLCMVCVWAECPKAIAQEIRGVFPKADPSQMLIVPTCQRASIDLVNTGEEVDRERDMLLERVRQKN